ncbi:MAG: hypothetical protein MK226_10930 [Saprospiraceae bacterium]|nr:hypothetical protein [Saprospiraceae bacterium]
MNRRHPTDKAFSERLEHYSLEPPMDIWNRIDQKRDWRHKLSNHLRLKWLVYTVSTFAICLVTLVSLFSDLSKSINHFPIPLAKAERAQLVADQPEKANLEIPAPTFSNHPKEVNTASTTGVFTSTSIPTSPIPTTITSTQQEEILLIAPTIRIDEDDLATTVYPNLAQEEIVIIEGSTSSSESNESISLNVQKENTLAVELLSNDWKGLETNYTLGDELRITDTECAKFGPKKGQLFIDFILSPDIALREMSPKNAEYNDYVWAREVSEKSVFAYSAALRMSVVSGMGFVMRSGISYSQINEKFEHIDENYERTEIIKITNSLGEVIGMDTVTEYGTRIRTTHNRFQTLDLPLIVGYELYYDKFAFSINAGPYFNLSFRQKGSFLSPTNLQPISFSSNDPDGIKAFKKQLGLGWYGSLGFQYRLDNKVSLLIEPYFKIYPKSFTNENFAVRQRYFTTGLSLGIRRQL